MVEFPTSIPLPDLPFRQQPEDPGLLFEPEDGPIVSRRRKTRIYWTFWLNWHYIPLSDTNYQTLMTFLNETVGGSSAEFTWEHPIDKTKWTVRCIAQSEWEWGANGVSGWSGGIVLRGYKNPVTPEEPEEDPEEEE
jgi:hypothetical protein